MAIIMARKQQGIALVAALLMLLIVTTLGVTLMNSSNVDVKVSNMAQLAKSSEQIVRSDSDQALQQQMALDATQNKLLYLSAQFSAQGNKVNITPNSSDSNVTLRNKNSGPEVVDCPPQFAATSSLKCNFLEIASDLKYGKKQQHHIAVHTGIIQQLAISGDSL